MRWPILLCLVACAPTAAAPQPEPAPLFLIRHGDIPGPLLTDCTRACGARVRAGYAVSEDCPHLMLEAALAGMIQDRKGHKLTCADVAEPSHWRAP